MKVSILIKGIFAILFIIELSSCEGYYRFNGKIIDTTWHQRINNPTIYFVLEKHDTMTLYSGKIIRDSLTRNVREKLRKNGKKDDYDSSDEYGFYKYSKILIDSSGYFSFHTGLISHNGKTPTGKLVIIAKPYKDLIVPIDKLTNDSLMLFLVK